jgi:pimeloyl-ACP methyl ester carboxylesterase
MTVKSASLGWRTKNSPISAGSRTWSAMLSTDLASQRLRFEIPIFFFQGADDSVTPASLAKDYFDRIDAPHKEFVPLPGAGHFAVWSMPGRFLQELGTRVRPLAVGGPAKM